MLTYAISKYAPTKLVKPEEPIEVDKNAIFNRHLNRCHFKVGDKIYFKKPKKHRIEGVIKHIEQDMTKVHWGSTKPHIPYYIEVEVIEQDGRKLPKNIKTYESKIKKGK